MGIHVYWDDENKTILRFDFEAQWTWDEYNQARDEGFALVEGISYRIHQLVDMRQMQSVPPSTSIKRVIPTSEAPSNLPEFGVSVIVGAPRIIEIFVKVLNKLYLWRVKPEIVEDLETAYTCIKKFEAKSAEN